MGPGGAELITNRTAIERDTRFDPARAQTLLSVATSYTLGVRADGVDTEPLAQTLRPVADRSAHDGEWQLPDIGTEWSVPTEAPAEELSGMGARIALRTDAAVAARTDRARAGLTTPSERVLSDPAVLGALECLGDVVAARLIPSNFTHAPTAAPSCSPSASPTRAHPLVRSYARSTRTRR